MDDFKAVNDTYGHPEGDYVLKKLAIFLSQVMRKEDIVARIGGRRVPHFCPGLGDRSCRRARARAFGSRALRRPAGHRRGRRPDLSRGAHHQRGAACCLTPPMPFEVLYAAADSTLYQVKEAGKAQYQLTVIG